MKNVVGSSAHSSFAFITPKMFYSQQTWCFAIRTLDSSVIIITYCTILTWTIWWQRGDKIKHEVYATKYRWQTARRAINGTVWPTTVFVKNSSLTNKTNLSWCYASTWQDNERHLVDKNRKTKQFVKILVLNEDLRLMLNEDLRLTEWVRFWRNNLQIALEVIIYTQTRSRPERWTGSWTCGEQRQWRSSSRRWVASSCLCCGYCPGCGHSRPSRTCTRWWPPPPWGRRGRSASRRSRCSQCARRRSRARREAVLGTATSPPTSRSCACTSPGRRCSGRWASVPADSSIFPTANLHLRKMRRVLEVYRSKMNCRCYILRCRASR